MNIEDLTCSICLGEKIYPLKGKKKIKTEKNLFKTYLRDFQASSSYNRMRT